MGTNTGATMAHFAEAEPMNRLMKAANSTKNTIIGMGPMPEVRKNSAPFKARMVPSLV